MSESAKQKISAALKLRKFSVETRLKISLARRGKASRKGFRVSEETKQKMRAAQIGRVMSAEHYQKFLQGMKRRRPARYWLGKRMESISGANHYNWKGGVTPLTIQIRNSSRYRRWRTDIFQRDNFRCVFCHKRGGDINADHWPIGFAQILRSENIQSFQDALDCGPLWELDNGRTLCKTCHHQRHSV